MSRRSKEPAPVFNTYPICKCNLQNEIFMQQETAKGSGNLDRQQHLGCFSRRDHELKMRIWRNILMKLVNTTDTRKNQGKHCQFF